MEVVGEAANGPDAVAQAEELVPDVVLMDIGMPDVNGIEATKQILHENPHIGIILVTMYNDAESVFSGMRAGALGYVLKGAEPEDLRHAIEAAHRGEVLLDQAIAARLLDRFDRTSKPPRQASLTRSSRPRNWRSLAWWQRGLAIKKSRLSWSSVRRP